MQTIATPTRPKAIGPYSQGIVMNGFLFTAGQIALDPATMEVVAGGITEQTERVMLNLQSVLAAAGSTSPTWSRPPSSCRTCRSSLR